MHKSFKSLDLHFKEEEENLFRYKMSRMYKRFKVLDLYFKDMTEEDGDWIKFDLNQNTYPPEQNTKVKIKLRNGDEHMAYFSSGFPPHFPDKNLFWHATTHEPFSNEDILYWRALKK